MSPPAAPAPLRSPSARTRRRPRLPARLSRLSLAAAVLLGLSSPALASPYVWTGGAFVPGVTAPNPLPAGEELQISGATNKSFAAVAFENLGTVAWSGGSILMSSAATIDNAGLWDIAGNLSMIFGGGDATTFTNTGVVRRSAGDGVASIGNSASFAFVNSGEIQALSGTLRLGGANSFLAGSSFTGSGIVEVSSNSTYSGSIQSANLRWTGATQTGNAAVLNGQAEWSGTAGLAGTWTVADGATVTAIGSGNKGISGAETVVTNAGTLAWAGTGALALSSGAQLVNTGVIDLQAAANSTFGGGTAVTLVNSGVLRNSHAGLSQVGNNASYGLVNSGTLEAAQAGAVLRLAGGNSFLDGSSFTGAGTVEVSSNSSYSGNIQSASLRWTGATQTGNGAVLGGQVTWAAGTVAGSWTVADGATLTATGTSNRSLSGEATVLNNAGTLAWAGTGALIVSGGAQLVNTGTLDLQAAANVLYGGGVATALVNEGLLRNSSGGLTVVSNSASFAVVNRGTLEATEGSVLRLSGANLFEAGSVIAGAGRVEANGASTYAGSFQSTSLRWMANTQTGDNAVLNGQVEWAGSASLAGTWTVAEGATLTTTGASSKNVSGAGTVLTNAGTFAKAGTGSLLLTSGAQLVNTGLMDIQGSGSITFGGGDAVRFDNPGELRVGSGAQLVISTSASLEFNHTGVIDVREGGQINLPNAFGSDGTITGDGTVFAGGAGGLLNRGTVAPGSFGAGTLNIAGVYTQAAEGLLAIDLTDLLSFDLLSVSGSASLAGTLALNCLGACSFEVGDSITIVQTGTTFSGTFGEVTLSGFATGSFDVIYDFTGREVRLLVTEAVTPIPEPGTWALWLAGLGTLGWMLRRRRELSA